MSTTARAPKKDALKTNGTFCGGLKREGWGDNYSWVVAPEMVKTAEVLVMLGLLNCGQKRKKHYVSPIRHEIQNRVKNQVNKRLLRQGEQLYHLQMCDTKQSENTNRNRREK